MNKPIPKKEIAIKWRIGNLIAVNATVDAASELQEFGGMSHGGLNNTNSEYWLCVDSHYDVDEVVAYIENCGNSAESGAS